MIWVSFAFLASFSRAAARVANEYIRLPGLHLVLGTKILIALYMLPFALVVAWPQDPLFYVLLVLQAPLVVYQDRKTFDLTAEYGGGIVSRNEPLTVAVLFVSWLAVNPALLARNLADPLRFAAIIAALAFTIYCALRMRRCAVSLAALKKMVPLIFVSALVSVLSKFCIDRAPGDGAVFIYIFVQSLVMVLLSLLYNTKTQIVALGNLVGRTALPRVALLSLATVTSVLARVYAFRHVDNPAYVNAIVLLAPFWVVLFYKVVKHEEKGDVISGVGVVCGSIALTLLAAR